MLSWLQVWFFPKSCAKLHFPQQLALVTGVRSQDLNAPVVTGAKGRFRLQNLRVESHSLTL